MKLRAVLGLCVVFTVLFTLHTLAAEPKSVGLAEVDLALKDIDPAACASFDGKNVTPASIETVAGVLGLAAPPTNYGWRAVTEAVPTEEPRPFQFRIAFRRPVSVGSLLATGTAESISFLKDDAPFPGDPAKPAQWTTVETLPHQSGSRLATLAASTPTRAVLIRERASSGWPSLMMVRLFQGRLHNVAPRALAYADREYTPSMSVVTSSASLVTTGTGAWINTGKNAQGRIPTPAITDINPAWFMLAWDKEETLNGLWVADNFVTIELDYFVGPNEVNPRVGIEDEWQKIKDFKQRERQGRWIEFKPVTTRGLRIRILKTDKKDPQIATITGLQAFTDLGDKPVPPAQQSGDTPPPKQIPYEVAEAGGLTMVVNRPDGRRARNIVARDPRTKGKHSEGWDLKDETGAFVSPGTYQWKALVHPRLEVKYETTVYPNILNHSPENSPWLNGNSGPGGWLADHTPPVGVCTAGDRVYLSAYVAESGVSFIECDLTGKKLWGHHSFAAWTGPRFLASNGKTVYVGSQILNTTTDAVWAVDIESKKVTEALSLTPTATRKRGMQGTAAHGDHLAISIQARENWLANAAAAEDVDPEASFPLYGPKRKPRFAYEIVPDQRGDFLRLFRLVENPPGGETPYTLTYLQSMKSARPQQHIVLAFKQPVPIGSVVFPVPQTDKYRVRLSTLKSDAPYPPNPEKSAQWQSFEEHGTEPWDVVPAPEDTVTRALRISFVKGDDTEGDPLAQLIETPKENDVDPLDLDAAGAKKESRGDLGEDQSRWFGELEGMKILRRRYVSRLPEATIRVNSGEVDNERVWDARRNRPLTEADPGIYVMEWEEAQSLRGVAIREIDGKKTKIDVYTGDDAEINIEGQAGWEQVGEYEQMRRDVGNGYGLGFMNPRSRYVDGYVDFGKEVKTRAVRLRVVEQWADKGQAGCMGIRIDLGGGELDATRCRVFGVAPVQYIGGEPTIESSTNDRIEIYTMTDKKLVEEHPLPKPGEIAYGPKGRLFAISGTSVVEVGTKLGLKTLVSDLKAPTDLAFDAKGQLFVFDGGTDRRNVRVYDASGKYLRSIGKPGGFKTGPWDHERLGEVTAIDVDQENQLWVVENQYHPKRITVWATSGEFKKELLGNTPYGGGGVLDPEDKSKLYYGTLEFEIDWKTGLSKIKNLLLPTNWIPAEVPIRIDGRLYLVTRPQFMEMQAAIVYLYEKDHLKPVAAVGPAAHFEPLRRPDIVSKLGQKSLTDVKFIWTDRNGNGDVDLEEVTISPKPKGMYGMTNFNRDLSVQAAATRYQVKEFLPNGAPVYEEQAFDGLASRWLYRLNDGNFFHPGESSKDPEAVFAPDGTALWTYPNEGPGVQALGTSKAWWPGQVVSEFGIVGHETAHAGDLGEFVVIHGNTGEWNIWTSDGLLAGPIFRDLRDPKAKAWSMREHDRGMILKDITSGQEHFAGYFCRTKENKYYVVAGHNHASVLEVLGLDKVRRMSGKIEVTPEDIKQAEDWEQRQQNAEVYARAPVMDLYRAKEPPVIDGKLDEWRAESAMIELTPGATATLYTSYDDENLYLAYAVRNLGPLKNTGTQFDRLFKTGASVDLQIGVNAEASIKRAAPEEGDLRLLMTYVNDKPKAVLYQAVVPGTSPESAVRVVSPVAEVTFDRITEVDDELRMMHSEKDGTYYVEAAVPLSMLGLSPVPGMRLKLDWGVLTTGPDGNEVLRRLYWSNKATHVLADAPSEARLSPNLWGFVRFQEERPSAEDRLDAFDVKDGSTKKKKKAADLLDDLDK